MEEFLIALVVFALAIAGMAIGVIVSNRRLKGTCGGLSGMTDEEGHTICDACTDPAPECDGKPKPECVDSSNSQAPFSA